MSENGSTPITVGCAKPSCRCSQMKPTASGSPKLHAKCQPPDTKLFQHRSTAAPIPCGSFCFSAVLADFFAVLAEFSTSTANFRAPHPIRRKAEVKVFPLFFARLAHFCCPQDRLRFRRRKKKLEFSLLSARLALPLHNLGTECKERTLFIEISL